MTSFSIVAAAAPVLLALVPCLFSGPKMEPMAFVGSAPHKAKPAAIKAERRDEWWKPSALGIDNYS